MLYPFFALGMRAPARQLAFRRAVVLHVLVVAVAALAVRQTGTRGTAVLLAPLLPVVGIVEGALLVGWRLAQMPKSQALEFLLVSPVRPRRVFLAEALVGLGRLALVTLSGLPPLVLLVLGGSLYPADLVPLVIMPYLWG